MLGLFLMPTPLWERNANEKGKSQSLANNDQHPLSNILKYVAFFKTLFLIKRNYLKFRSF